jgi:hypothetical protein
MDVKKEDLSANSSAGDELNLSKTMLSSKYDLSRNQGVKETKPNNKEYLINESAKMKFQ